MKKTLFLIILIIITSIFAGPVSGQSLPEPSDDEVNAVAKQLYCPVCENIPLDVCPTQACVEWRELIRLKLAEGWDEDQIKQYFAEQYGDRVLATPPARGFNLLVFVIPVVGIMLGVFLLYKAFRSLQDAAPDDPGEEIVIEMNDEYVDRLEEEITK